ncbi:MAG: SRPBCC family protein [Jatrophihabitans sp.]|uniref:SRPBCC family protein n=1 Tax=Jatrophihabitans sp. TaxID=1932789 RepID=UPI0039169467
MPTSDPTASATVAVGATPEAVYRLITDLSVMTELAEETAVLRWRKGAGAEPGAVFRGTNRNGWRRWTTTCTVTDADPGRRFAFNVSHTSLPVARWQYDIEATLDGCTVTESTWDRRYGWFALASRPVTGVADRADVNTRNIEATLQRLKARAERTA